MYKFRIPAERKYRRRSDIAENDALPCTTGKQEEKHMAFCKNCGAPLEDGAKFCPNCGATAEEKTADTEKTSESAPKTEPAPDPKDLENNKAMAILAYIGWLVLIPIFAAKESPYARFHANQGLVLTIFATGGGVALQVLNAIVSALSVFLHPLAILATIIGILSSAVAVLFVVFMVLGIVNAAKGEMKELPFIGKIRILK